MGRMLVAVAVFAFGTMTAAGLSAGLSVPGRGWRSYVLPGTESTSLDHLDSAFRTKVGRVLARLRRQGFRPRVAATFRSRKRQEFVHSVGRVFQRLGYGPSTQARGGQSCHNHVDAKGRPAARAIDIWGGRPGGPAHKHARFFRALGAAAKAEGLVWGGRWRKRNKTWAKFGLGWDPAHIQYGRSCRRKR